jgi:hypothetical protein
VLYLPHEQSNGIGGQQMMKIRVIDRFRLINIINDLQEFDLITEKQGNRMLQKRDKQAMKIKINELT